MHAAFKEIANIDISDGNDGLRSTYDILADMAAIFPTLTDEQRQYLGEMASGNRNVKTLNAILSGWSDVEAAVASATDSMGSATIENEKYMDSIDGRLQKLQSKFQEVANTLIDSGIVKGVIEIGNALLGITIIGDGVPAKIIAFTTAVVALNAAFTSVSATKFVTNLINSFKDIGRPEIPGFARNIAAHIIATEYSFLLANVCTRVSINKARRRKFWELPMNKIDYNVMGNRRRERLKIILFEDISKGNLHTTRKVLWEKQGQ